MYAEKVRLSDIRYNPERAGFEARVAVNDHGTIWLYPAFVAAPLNAEYALVSRGTNDGMWDWNLQTNQLYLSERWRSMVGREATDWQPTGSEWMDLIHEEDRDRVRAELQRHFHGRHRRQPRLAPTMYSSGILLRRLASEPGGSAE